ncbi:MAG: hypothetical protein ACYS5V_05225 [Planctomycetota bacterium]|jgi:hypothetical protein
MWWCPEKPARTTKAAAFTLIETVLATALAATVMVAALAMLTRFGGWRRDRAAGDGPRAVADAVMRVVEADLLAGRTVQLGSSDFAVDGYGWLDPATGRPTHLPARVIYRIRQAGGRSWLVRRQTAPDEAGTARTSRELLCRGVERIVLSEPIGPGEEPAQRPWRVGLGDPVPVPATLKVTLTLDEGADGTGPTVERIIHLR